MYVNLNWYYLEQGTQIPTSLEQINLIVGGRKDKCVLWIQQSSDLCNNISNYFHYVCNMYVNINKSNNT